MQPIGCGDSRIFITSCYSFQNLEKVTQLKLNPRRIMVILLEYYNLFLQTL